MARTTRGKGPEAETLSKDEADAWAREVGFLRVLNESLHEMSQPMTVLLCTLEYGAGLESVEELRQTVSISQEACERLRKTVISMQMQVREAIEARAARMHRWV